MDYYGTVLCSGNYNYNGAAAVNFSSVSNVVYHILVGGAGGGNAGMLQITATFTNPPANDTCGNPTVLNNGMTVTQDVTYATEIGEPLSGCGASIGHGVWFTLAGYTGQEITIGTCGSSYATDLLVYTNGCGSLGAPFTCSSGSNPFNCPGYAGVSFISPTNTTYYILASGLGSGSGTLEITANQAPPANDMCNNAMLMVNGVTYSTNTIYATSIGDPVPSCSPGLGRGVWYSYTPTVSGPVGVTTCGSSFQTALAVYTGTCGAWTEVACSQSSGAYCNSDYNADINFYGLAGTNYYILAGGVNGQAGNLQIQIPVVDLVSTGLIATNPAGGLPTAGRTFFAGWSVQNQGTSSINGTWTDQLILSNANAKIVLASYTGPHNATNGGSYAESFSITLPQIQWGNYLLIAQADVSNAVAEADKTNNFQSMSLIVTDIPPAITLLMPTNTIQLTSCVPLKFLLSAGVQMGSYSITNVAFYNSGLLIGQVTNTPYRIISLPLDHGSNSIIAEVQDKFGLDIASTNSASIFVLWPGETNSLRADVFSNTCVICMAALDGTNYVIEAKTNLNSPAWQPLATNQITSGILVFTNQQTVPMRFYRTRY